MLVAGTAGRWAAKKAVLKVALWAVWKEFLWVVMMVARKAILMADCSVVHLAGLTAEMKGA